MEQPSTANSPSKPRRPLAVILATTVALVGCAGASLLSRSSPNTSGLQNGKLRAGPSSPNWVSSELPPDSPHYLAPFSFDGAPEAAWSDLQATVKNAGGTVETANSNYLHAVFVTRFLRFRDDFEARLDAANNVIHVRSGSRVGKYDTGTNRRRVERLRDRFSQATGPDKSASR